MDITSSLPASLRGTLESENEIIEAISVTPEHKEFLDAATTVQDLSGAEKIEITSDANTAWLKQTQAFKDLLPADITELNLTRLVKILDLRQGGTIWLSRRSKRPEVGYFVQRGSPIDTALPQGGWTPLGRLRIALSEAAQRSGALVLSPAPKFLWVTEFPLFTRADEDKEFLAHGRWSSSHHPFTAPMYEDIEKMLAKDVEDVSHSSAPRFHQSDSF